MPMHKPINIAEFMCAVDRAAGLGSMEFWETLEPDDLVGLDLEMPTRDQRESWRRALEFNRGVAEAYR